MYQKQSLNKSDLLKEHKSCNEMVCCGSCCVTVCGGAWEVACGMNILYGLLRSEMEGHEKRMLGKINGTTKQWMHCWRGLAE